MSHNKPSNLAASRVVAVIDPTDMFASEVCVFFDETYFQSFALRDGYEHAWKAVSGDSLVSRWGLQLPKTFREIGYATITRDVEASPVEQHGEVWLIGEVGPRP